MVGNLTVQCSVRFGSATEIAPDFVIRGEPGRITLLFGPSGCGKTTCLRLMAGLTRPHRGSIRFNGHVWAKAGSGTFLPPQQRRVGLLFQSYALFSHLNVRKNLAYGIEKLSRQARDARVSELADLLEIGDLLDQMPDTLSGGQAQRVALGRSLAPRPDWLLLDEPLSSLDEPLRLRLGAELRKLLHRLEIPSIVVTHDRREIETLGDDLIVLDRGRAIQSGIAREGVRAPSCVAAARILGFENILRIEPGAASGGGLTWSLPGGQLLRAGDSSRGSSPTAQHVAIAAEHIRILSPDQLPDSADNILTGRLEEIVSIGSLIRFRFAIPEQLFVHTTPQWLGNAPSIVGTTYRLALSPDATVLLSE